MCYWRIRIDKYAQKRKKALQKMNRTEQLAQLAATPVYDIVIIGGGATGLGCAVDSASRGYKTLLLEKYDFAKGTSSRATKLVHGGVRYLAQGNIRLVREALYERGRLLQNAPHVCHTLSFVVPSYKWWQKWYYGFGLWIYEFLSAKLSLGKTKLLSATKALDMLPGLSLDNFNGGVLYFDGQFDDSRLAINLAQTAVEQGATVINYCGVKNFIKKDSKIIGVTAVDEISGNSFDIHAEVVINATGVFADSILQLAENQTARTIAPSQGIHLVVDKHFFEGEAGMMIPKTDDGRVLFAIPWHSKLLLGTTDTPVKHITTEPIAAKEEIDFVIRNFNRYTAKDITYADVRSVFAGLRPLANAGGQKKTAVMPRDHQIKILPSGLVHVTGGKWTTYRRMAEDAVTKAAHYCGLAAKVCKTKNLQIHGWKNNVVKVDLAAYGADALLIKKMIAEDEGLAEKIHPDYPYTKAEVKWIVQNEMAITIEDVLARRIRLLFLDAKAAMEAAPGVAALMAAALHHNKEWEVRQVDDFVQLAKGYLIAE
jgi:glycerol-3-phosphate dehydrogenase